MADINFIVSSHVQLSTHNILGKNDIILGESWSARVEISTNQESKKFQDFIEQGLTLKKKYFQTLKI